MCLVVLSISLLSMSGNLILKNVWWSLIQRAGKSACTLQHIKQFRYIHDFVTMTTGRVKQCGGKTVISTAFYKNKISLKMERVIFYNFCCLIQLSSLTDKLVKQKTYQVPGTYHVMYFTPWWNADLVSWTSSVLSLISLLDTVGASSSDSEKSFYELNFKKRQTAENTMCR